MCHHLKSLDFRAFEIPRCLGQVCLIWKTKNGMGAFDSSQTAQCSGFKHTTSTCHHALGSLGDDTCTVEDILKQTSISSDLLNQVSSDPVCSSHLPSHNPSLLSMLSLVRETLFLNTGRTSHNHWRQIWRARTGASLGHKTQDLVQKVKAKTCIKTQKITLRQLPRQPNCVRKLAPCSVSDGVVFLGIVSDPLQAPVLMVSS